MAFNVYLINPEQIMRVHILLFIVESSDSTCATSKVLDITAFTSLYVRPKICHETYSWLINLPMKRPSDVRGSPRGGESQSPWGRFTQSCDFAPCASVGILFQLSPLACSASRVKRVYIVVSTLFPGIYPLSWKAARSPRNVGSGSRWRFVLSARQLLDDSITWGEQLFCVLLQLYQYIGNEDNRLLSAHFCCFTFPVNPRVMRWSVNGSGG
jgi:hypothetical protein